MAENESLRFSLYDVLGFNRLYDEEEVLEEKTIETEAKNPVDETKTVV